MVLKLAAIFVMLIGMFAYAQSAAVSGPSRPVSGQLVRRMESMGYVLVHVTKEPRNVTVNSFELRLPSKPHFHTVAWIDLILRDDKFLNFAHGESLTDVAD